jgi:DNA polymerase III sliding clamp (beta) subunit (PCNA family)
MNTVGENKIQTDTVELENAALIELLEGASTHAHKDKSLLSLNAVQLEGEGAGYLMARATDRYRLITGKREVEHGQLSKSLLSLSDVKRVIELAKSNKVSRVTLNRIGDLLTISVTGSSITVQL